MRVIRPDQRLYFIPGVGIVVREAGGGGASTIPQYLMQGETPIPAVIFSFDDGHASDYTQAWRYCRAKHVRCTSYIVTGSIGGPVQMSADQLIELDSGGWCIANHTTDHTKLTTLDQAAQQVKIGDARDALDALGLTKASRHLAYPYCAYDANTLLAMAAEGMETGRKCADVLFFGQLTAPYEIPAYNIDAAISLATAKGYIDAAVTAGKVVMFYLHEIGGEEAGDWPVADFEALVDYVLAEDVLTLTIDDLYNLQSGPIAYYAFDDTPPVLSSVEVGTVTSSTVVAVFDEKVTGDGDLLTGVSITVDAAAATISSATRQSDQKTVYYVLDTPVAYGETVLFSYTTATGKIENLSGVDLASITDRAVTNNVPETFTLTLQPDGTAGVDCFISSGSPTGNWNSAALQMRTTTTVQHGFIKFDLSSIPSGSTIYSATLSLWTHWSVTGNGTLTINRILAANSAWTETGAKWNYQTGTTPWAGDTGADGGADAGCSQSGTDFAATALGTSDWASGEAVGTQHDFTFNVSEMQAMFEANHGMVLRVTAGTRYIDVYSSDEATETTRRPKLVVQYY